MRTKSKKNLEVESFVDAYYLKHKVPPTYKMIESEFKLSSSAAYARCEKFRYKMVSNKNKGSEDQLKKIKSDFEYAWTNDLMFSPDPIKIYGFYEPIIKRLILESFYANLVAGNSVHDFDELRKELSKIEDIGGLIKLIDKYK